MDGVVAAGGVEATVAWAASSFGSTGTGSIATCLPESWMESGNGISFGFLSPAGVTDGGAAMSFGDCTGAVDSNATSGPGLVTRSGVDGSTTAKVERWGIINRATEAISTNIAAANSNRRGQFRTRGAMAMTLPGAAAPAFVFVFRGEGGGQFADFVQGGACFRGAFEDLFDGRAFGGVGQLAERVGGQPGVFRVEGKGFGVHGMKIRV